MTTSDELTEQALSLASAGIHGKEGVLQLLTTSGGRRVAVVLARRSLLDRMTEQTGDEATSPAVEILDAVLTRLPD